MREGKMRTWPWLMVCAAVTLAGCRTDPQIALLEREMRMLEDKNYQLQFALEDSQRALQKCQQCQVAPPGAPVKTGQPAPSTIERAPASSATEPSGAPKQVAPPDVEMPATPGQETVPDTLRTPPSAAPKAAPAPGPAPKFKPSAGGPQQGNMRFAASQTPAPSRLPMVSSAAVHSIALNRALTGGYRPIGRPADEGVSVFVQLLDAQGRPVRASGPISVVALDRQEKGESARVGRWDFSAQEVTAQFTEAMEGQGIHLEMGWGDDPPSHDRLQVYVRFTTADGRKLEAHQAIEVQLASSPSRYSPEGPALIEPATLSAAEANSNAARQTDAQAPVEEDRDTPATSTPRSRPAKAIARPAWSPYR
jgi:hypothetical protein